MRTFTQNEPLTDAELDRLGDFLKSCKCGRAMNVEQLDGFFAALIAGPETVMPSEYYPEVFGGEMSDACEFGSHDEANEILGLMMRHWNAIAGMLFEGEVYVPLLLEGDDGMAHGNDWARGFMRDMGMRHDGWAAAALAGFLMFTGVPRLLADNDDCQRRVVRADHRLHEAIEHHGYVSHQAERRRHELHEARERCWNRSHRWWNEHEHR